MRASGRSTTTTTRSSSSSTGNVWNASVVSRHGRSRPTPRPTYEQLFRLGIAANLFRDVEAAADTVVKDGSPSPTTLALAHLVRIIARADRGAFEDSLDCLRLALAQREKTDKPAARGPPSRPESSWASARRTISA